MCFFTNLKKEINEFENVLFQIQITMNFGMKIRNIKLSDSFTA